MKDDTRKAVKLVWTLTVAYEPRLRPLGPWYWSLIKTIDQWAKAESNQGVKRAKAILGQAMQIIYGEHCEPLPFVKQTGALPLLVEPLVRRVEKLGKSARVLSAVLSLIRVTDLWEGDFDESVIRDQLKVIKDTKLPNTARPIIKDFGGFVANLLATPAYRTHPLVRAMLRPLRIDRTVIAKGTRGPNGPLTESAHLDVLSLRNSKVASLGPEATMVDGLRKLEVAMRPYLSEVDKEVAFDTRLFDASDEELLKGARVVKGRKINPCECPGKLSFKREKSGKVRIIAMPDYWTQAISRPIGEWLRNILLETPADCTWKQGNGEDLHRIVKWQEEGKTVFSFDHSSCTDLFPLDMQTEFLAQRFDRSLSESVGCVMTEREWFVRFPKSRVTTKVKWSVGQPMGVYTSWPLMAVTHHLLVQYASWRATADKSRWEPFENYVILGDDVVIAGPRVADSYLKLVKLLGMKVNKSKSHISGGRTGIEPVSEFRKIMVWKGIPLTPLKPHMVLAAVRDYRQALPLLWHLAQSWKLSLKALRAIANHNWPKQAPVLKFLLTMPTEVGGVGLRTDKSLKGQISAFVGDDGGIHPLLMYIAEKIRLKLRVRQRAVASLESSVTATPSWWSLSAELRGEHPDCSSTLDNALRDIEKNAVLTHALARDIFGYSHDDEWVMIPKGGLNSLNKGTLRIAELLISEGFGRYSSMTDVLLDEMFPSEPVLRWEADRRTTMVKELPVWFKVMKMIERRRNVPSALVVEQANDHCLGAIPPGLEDPEKWIWQRDLDNWTMLQSERITSLVRAIRVAGSK